jgi:hypothetical protein
MDFWQVVVLKIVKGRKVSGRLQARQHFAQAL